MPHTNQNQLDRDNILTIDSLYSWWNLLIARFVLGFAVGAKSSTTPVYAAESAPKTIRGALTMQWQMWTAFGIMLGFVASVAFQDLDYLGEYTQWRWMLGSTAIPPFIVLCQVYFCPESPRWYVIILSPIPKNDPVSCDLGT